MTELVVKSWLQVPLVHEMPGGVEVTVPWPIPRRVTLRVGLAVAESGVDALPELDETESDADLVPGELGANLIVMLHIPPPWRVLPLHPSGVSVKSVAFEPVTPVVRPVTCAP